MPNWWRRRRQQPSPPRPDDLSLVEVVKLVSGGTVFSDQPVRSASPMGVVFENDSCVDSHGTVSGNITGTIEVRYPDGTVTSVSRSVIRIPDGARVAMRDVRIEDSNFTIR